MSNLSRLRLCWCVWQIVSHHTCEVSTHVSPNGPIKYRCMRRRMQLLSCQQNDRNLSTDLLSVLQDRALSQTCPRTSSVELPESGPQPVEPMKLYIVR